MNTLSDICKQCGKCCQAIVLPVVKPLQKAVMGYWLKARGCEIVGEDTTGVYVKFNMPCPHLTKSAEGYTCDDYENRPEGCRVFDGRHSEFVDCAWKSIPKNYVVLEKAGVTCPTCGRKNAVQMGSRYKREEVWVRRFRCPNGHLFEEVQ